MWLLAVWTTGALAGALDIIEVGGPWSTPATANAASSWWNPAALARAGGTGFLIEGAPTFGRVTYDRTSPDYGPAVDHDGDGVVDPYDYGGRDELRAVGAIPFAGMHTDLGVPGLGLGLAAAAPYGRGGREVDAPGSGSFHMRWGQIATVHGILAASYGLGDSLAVGASVATVHSTWSAEVDAETLSVLKENAGGLADYADPLLEDRAYVATLEYDRLRDLAATFGAGVYWTPTDRVAVALAYVHGTRLEHTGDIELRTSCPPESDVVGRVASSALGLCDSVVAGTGGVAYELPSRIHGGVALHPDGRLRLEAMGGWVGWSAFSDYEVEADFPPDSLTEALNPEEASARLAQERLWARDSRDTFWAGVDGRWTATDVVELGFRALYDHPAVPTSAVSTNNYDAPTLSLGAAGRVAVGPLHLGVSAAQWIIAKRTVEDSVFAVTLGEDPRPERAYYPSAAGTYRGSVTRLGVSVQGRFAPRAGPRDDS